MTHFELEVIYGHKMRELAASEGHVAKLPKLIPSDYGNINRKTRAVPVPYDIREAIIAELKERPARTWPLADSINRSRVYVATIVTKLHSEGVINRANRKDEWRVVDQ